MPTSRPRAMLSAARSSGMPSELVAQHVGDELVDLVAGLAGHAADDRAGRRFMVDRTCRRIGRTGDRVEEAVEQRFI